MLKHALQAEKEVLPDRRSTTEVNTEKAESMSKSKCIMLEKRKMRLPAAFGKRGTQADNGTL